VENQIRKEHSAPTDSYGVRQGSFQARAFKDPAQKSDYSGSVYNVVAGETLASIAARCGLQTLEVSGMIFTEEGEFVAGVKQGELVPKVSPLPERLLIRQIFWHTVGSGETLESIARLWNATPESLKRANPDATKAGGPKPGQRLLIPVR
jgi:LysM repeat protein